MHQMLIIQKDCEQGIVALNSCLILNQLFSYFNLSSYLIGDNMVLDTQLKLYDVVTKTIFLDRYAILFILDQFALDKNPQPTESLLKPHMTRAYKVMMINSIQFIVSS